MHKFSVLSFKQCIFIKTYFNFTFLNRYFAINVKMELPYEVLVIIFKYLTEGDRKAASETCQSWYIAANNHSFLKSKVAVFYRASLNEESISPLNIFENSSVIHYNYFFNDVEISNKVNYFWDKMGEHIKSLTLKSCDVCEKVFTYILEKCTNLETLNILSCKDLFMSGRLLEGKTEGLFKYKLENLKVLSLAENQYLTDALFSRFIVASPALEELNLSACSLQFHVGLVKKFYPSDVDMFQSPSESVFTFSFVLKVIASRAENIKHLILSHTLIDGASLKILSETENLKLEYLSLHCCDQLTNVGIKALTTHQTSLKSLNLGLCNRVTDQSLVFICQNLVNLEELNIQRCRAVTNLGIVLLHNLKKLKSLNISQCENITKEGLQNGICIEENKTIEELDVHSLNLDESTVILISQRMPNLKILNLSYCFNAVTDASIQVIFENQVLLKVLKMSHCDKVSDAGLTGMGKQRDGQDNEIEPTNESPTTSFDESPASIKICLGSRAEEEIIRDARRKRDVMRMCERISTETYTGYSLARLKDLRELDISNCNKITDVSLTYAFNFKGLIELNLSHCQQITHEGMEHLVKNCRTIENLDLTDCYNLKDDAVIIVVQGLQRLKHLQLKGCNQLTDKTIDAVTSYCQKLKFLDVQGCRNITPELACNMGLHTLHTVLMTKPGPYTIEGVKDRKPAASFLPALMRKLRLH